MEIINMNLDKISEYAKLYISVFNSEPWNDSWTYDSAFTRIKQMMKTETFVGKALYSDNDLKGIIWGQKEQYFNGIHFQIQEFCVKTAEQKQGYGKALLNALENELKACGVTNIFLITSKGEQTEGYYQQRGFLTSDYMVLMANDKF